MKRVIIIGGGIGGLAAAACLKVRGEGRVEVRVYERASELREVGAALAVWPNAGRVLERIGVFKRLVERSHVAPVGALRDVRGRVLKEMVRVPGDLPVVFSHRAELLAAILSAVPAEWIQLGKECVGVERREEGVRAVFADGSVSPWADGLVGADGIRSVVRAKTIRDGEAAYRGYVCWRGVAPSAPQTIVGETWGRGRRFGLIPLGDGRVAWWATANDRRPGETLKRSPAEWKEEVTRLFGEWHAPIPEVVAGTPEVAVICNAIADRVPRDVWGEGRVTLLGDAAHPTTPNLGQGACMAIEDAAVLAHTVVAIPDMATAFRVYEGTRAARTRWIVEQSLKFGRMGQWENPLACAFRNWLVRHGPEGRLRKQFYELWEHDAWEEPLVMPG